MYFRCVVKKYCCHHSVTMLLSTAKRFITRKMEELGESPHLCIRVIQRCRCNPNDVWFPLVYDYRILIQRFKDTVEKAWLEAYTQLRSTLCWI